MAALAGEIWQQHFTPIIGAEQVAYMVEKFQSAPAMAEQMKTGGYQYFFMELDGILEGYVGVVPGDGALFLSKLYLRQALRGKHIATRALDFLKEKCRTEGLSKIWLTVNRHNDHTIAVYKKLGFATVREQVSDIGNGYVMDDYVMELSL